ncbi:MAG: ABC transporter substrate-binding protein [Desulfatiglans sp.]|nr:ABC transporter substrate-binding protein [Thermodesulfobacteriota bacterium]MEE4353343.1 ABC transporter substrate-binding protein [Desulfatiglans sp.]
MKEWKGKTMRACLISVLVATFFFGMGIISDVSAERKSIKIWNTLAMTGPASSHYRPIWYAIDSYWKVVNERDGGVGGIPVEVIAHDNQYNIQKVLTGYARIRQDPHILMTCSSMSAIQEALKPKLMEDNMPMVAAGSVAVNTRPTTQFSPLGDYTLMAGAWIKWFKENWEKEGGIGPIKIGAILQPIGCFRDDWAGIQKFARDMQVEVVGHAEVPLAPGEYTPELLKLKSNGANLIFAGTIASTLVPLMKDAYKLGLTKKIKFISSAAVSGTYVITELAGKAAEGLYGVYFGDHNADTEAAREMVAATNKYHNFNKYELANAAGWWYMWLIHKAFDSAANKVGASAMTHQDVLAALQGMGKIDAPPGMSGPLDFTDANPLTMGGTTASIIKVVNGKHVRCEPKLLKLPFHKPEAFKEFRK